MRYQAVIFDLDGTLIDTETLWVAAAKDILRQMSHHPDPALFERLIGVDLPTSAGIMAAAFPGLDLQDFDARLRAETNRIEASGIPLKPGVSDLLERLGRAGLPRAVATSSRFARAHHKLAVAGIKRHFAAVVTYDCVMRAKPAPDAYLLAAQRLGVAPEACLAFEDSDPGTRAAHAAGMTVVQVPDVVAPGTDLAHFIAPTVIDGARMAGLLV